MYRAVLLGATAGVGLVQCLAWMASPPSVPDGELVDEQVF